ncbi:hypothetical protein LUZ60_003856 [Juncus effusus]|nr:hypothetical protein LUZ60_003856 [Juncus effusus]
MMMRGERGETRKGPWTEKEDLRLVYFVRVLGERRWNFLAKLSGLDRTGKSCRLRWVNYLNLSLKRGRMTPQEEELIIDLHAKWGNKWSKIASKLPGRTDNGIKNYWRTRFRKKAQEEKKSSSSSISMNSTNNESELSLNGLLETEEAMNVNLLDQFDNGGNEIMEMASKLGFEELYSEIECYNNDISCNSVASPVWNYNPEPLWMMDDIEFH